jgi:phasin family protein
MAEIGKKSGRPSTEHKAAPRPGAVRAKAGQGAPAKEAAAVPSAAVPSPAPPKAKPAGGAVKPPLAAKPTPPVAAKPPVAPPPAAPKPQAVKPPLAAKPPEAPKPQAAAPAPAEAQAHRSIVEEEKAVPSALPGGDTIMNEALNKVEDNAKTFTNETTNKAQAVFGDMSEKAKGAYEKTVKFAEEMAEFSRGNVEAFVESSRLCGKGVESLGQEAADYARKSFESNSAAFKTFASAKSPTELFKLQSDYMKSSFDSAIAESSKVTEAWLKLAGEVMQPVSNRFALAMEKARAVSL